MQIAFAPTLLVLFSTVPDNPNPWTEVKNEDGIRVMARDVPNSRIREIKVEAVVEAPAETVWAVVNDQPHYVEFMPYVLEVRILPDDAGPNARYEYHFVDPPLVDPRDYTLKATFETNPEAGRYRRFWSAAAGRGPAPQKGVVRITLAEGYWQIERRTDSSARVTYWLYTDPGGSIPAWIANKANTTSVPNLIRAVRNRSRDPNWRRD